MGNRTMVKFSMPIKHKDHRPTACTYYLHWNGGPESTHAFYNALWDFMNERNRPNDLDYFQARWCQLVGHYLGDVLSLGIVPVKEYSGDGMDNPPTNYSIIDRAPDKFIRSTEDQKKYDRIYKECLSYLRSTCNRYDTDQKYLDAIDEQIKALEDKKKEVLEQREYKEKRDVKKETV